MAQVRMLKVSFVIPFDERVRFEELQLVIDQFINNYRNALLQKLAEKKGIKLVWDEADIEKMDIDIQDITENKAD